MWRAKFFPLLLLSGCTLSICSAPGLAQIVPDDTLGSQSSVVIPNDNVDEAIADLIKGGAVRDNNLFHSFSEFNVGEGGAAYFTNPDGVDNILTRITGNSLSDISGTLGVEGAANLFLLNPNGIVFGENSTLDMGGSFLATTADRYTFENGFAYGASNPQIPPLLTINIPKGLQFGVKAESIVNQSQTLGEFNFPAGLQVDPGNNITLLGGDIRFEAGNLTAPSGQVEIGAVAPNSKVTIDPFKNNWTLGYDQVQVWQDIRLTQQSSIDTSGDGSGGVQINGRQIRILEGSGIFAINFGEQDSGVISIYGSESVELIGGTTEERSVSLVQSAADNVGRGGSVEIKTDSLRLIDGGQIGTGANGSGDSGSLSIETKKTDTK